MMDDHAERSSRIRMCLQSSRKAAAWHAKSLCAHYIGTPSWLIFSIRVSGLMKNSRYVLSVPEVSDFLEKSGHSAGLHTANFLFVR
jgi:hypothetical protein